MIDLLNDLCIKVDENQYTVCRKQIVKSGKKAGEITYNILGYYGTLPQALQGAYKHCIKSVLITDNIIDLKEAIERVNKVHDDFTKLVNDSIKTEL